MTRRGQWWNHNTHYHGLILEAIPPGCQRVLDVGCGAGMLARQLARLVPHVVGLDSDAASLGLARRQDPDGKIALIRGDFRTHPFAPAAFNMITSVAALHHMDARATLDRMSQLLAPGGRPGLTGSIPPRSRGRRRTPMPRCMPWPGKCCQAPGTAVTCCGATH